MHFARAFMEAGAPPTSCSRSTAITRRASASAGTAASTTSSSPGPSTEGTGFKRRRRSASSTSGSSSGETIRPTSRLTATSTRPSRTSSTARSTCGESCCAVERVYVHKSLYQRFVDACEPLVRAYVLGDPKADKTTLGPVAQPHHIPELESLVADAIRKGARLVAGGDKTSVDGKGRFFEPTLLADVPQHADLMQRESFGPLVVIAPVDSDEEALQKMNDFRLGSPRASGRATSSARRMARALEFGTVYMNRCDSVDPALPWTSVKDSGRGSSLSALGFDQLTRPKSIHFRLSF